jgi:hypothetical protein
VCVCVFVGVCVYGCTYECVGGCPAPCITAWLDTPGIMFELRLARLTDSVGTNLSRAAASPSPLDLGPHMPSIRSTPRKVITIARLPERRRQG